MNHMQTVAEPCRTFLVTPHMYARAHTRAHDHSRRSGSELHRRLGGAGAIMVPYWWEYESPLKRRLALEAMMRRMFALVPELR